MSDDSDCFLMDDGDDSGFSSGEEVVALPKKRPPTGKSSKAPLKPSNASNVGSSSATSTSKPKSKKTVEETYQKLSQLEHILKRPDTYIGSTEPTKERMFILQGERIAEKEITYTPGLYKIFDEIVVNAADNKQRDPNMTKLEININGDTISVKNNGKGIPIVMHKDHGIYVPTLIFGHLLTGSNFDDDEKKTTGGRNGYGAKLANVFSTKFMIECVDVENKLKFCQTFHTNMTVALDPVVKKCTQSELKSGDYVKITFTPDLEKFQMDALDEDTVGLLSKRAYDIAGSMANRGGKKLVVYLNEKKLGIKNFKDYLKTYDGVQEPIAYISTDSWEVGISGSKDGTQQQISFVNAIATSKGGRHVKYIADQVADHLAKAIKKKAKVTITKAQIGNHLSIMVNCLITNPSFDSQTKDSLTTQVKDFGSTFKLTDTFLKKLEGSDLFENIVSWSQFRDKQSLKRQGGKKKAKLTGISKLDDANNAGTTKSKDCTLIITEGDSAKSLAVAGLSVVGRDYYGVFPLKGKPLNVRDCASKDITKNVEIKNLVDIMGLKYGVVYEDTKSLRYGHLTIMADQDTDGSHIKGLVINFIHHFWPSLLEIPGFLQQFITPIVKVTKGKKSRTFFTLPEYEQWYEATEGRGYKIKYYKGLGTSTSAEAKEYFSHLDTHLINFATMSRDSPLTLAEDQVVPDSVRSSSDLIDMVFRKDRVEDRKQWLAKVPSGIFCDYTQTATSSGIKYSEFFNKEYILFSDYDLHRSIPHLIDGLKPSQRKVLFACFKRKLTKNEIKVAQLVGYIAEHSAYHHGEASLQGTIVNMAQNFVGSNNINLLTPSGQFGTRRMGGKDAASPRYIFTKLEPIARTIFHPDDDDLLDYLNDDGTIIEPEFYIPVIPMILCNGGEGIGTGWSCSVSNYNPREIVAKLRRRIKGEDWEQDDLMSPFYSGFIGEIKKEQKNKFVVRGIIERVDDVTLHISELPLKKWTQTYKEFLETMLVSEGKTVPDLKDLKENHTETSVSFTLTAEKEKIDSWEHDPKGLYGKLKLTASLSTSNMTLFNAEGRITRYDSPEDIIDAFYEVRLDFYDKRKAKLIEKLEAEKLTLSNKARFVEEVCLGELVVSNRKKKELLEDLHDRKYDLITSKEKPDEEDEEDNDEADIATLAKGYEYLLGMKIWSLTFERAEELRRQLAEKTEQLESLKATEPSQLWLDDLDAVEEALGVRDQLIEEDRLDECRAQATNKKRNKKIASKKAAAKRKKPKKKNEWDSDMEEDSAESDIVDSDSEDELFAKKPAAKPTKEPAPTKKSAARTTAKAGKQVKMQPPKKTPIATSVVDSDEDVVMEVEKGSVVDPDLHDPLKLTSGRNDSPPPSDSEDEDFLSLSERLKASKKSKKRPSPRNSETEGEDDDVVMLESNENPIVSKKAPAKKKKAPASKRRAVAKAIDLSEDSDVASEGKPLKQKAASGNKKAPPKPRKKETGKAAKQPRKKQAVSNDSGDEDLVFPEDEGADLDFSDGGGLPSPPPARSNRPARNQTKKTKYTFVDSESDNDSDFS